MSFPSSTNLTPDQLKADQGPGIVTGNIIVAVAAIVAVPLRTWSRKLKNLRLGIDDWLIIAALVSEDHRTPTSNNTSNLLPAIRFRYVCSRRHR